MTETLPGKESFLSAARHLLTVVTMVPRGSWEAPGIGAWTVRDLAGHASRAVSTVSAYIDAAPAVRMDQRSAGEYFAALLPPPPELHENISARAKAAGVALGERPADVISTMIADADARLKTTPSNRLIMTPAGGMKISDYLETRVVELVMHSIDLADALGSSVRPPEECLEKTAGVLVEIAACSDRTLDMLRILCGRRSKQDFSLV